MSVLHLDQTLAEGIPKSAVRFVPEAESCSAAIKAGLKTSLSCTFLFEYLRDDNEEELAFATGADGEPRCSNFTLV